MKATKETFITLAKTSKSVDNFMEDVRKIKNVPKELSDWFFQKYARRGELSMHEASKRFIAQQAEA